MTEEFRLPRPPRPSMRPCFPAFAATSGGDPGALRAEPSVAETGGVLGAWSYRIRKKASAAKAV